MSTVARTRFQIPGGEPAVAERTWQLVLGPGTAARHYWRDLWHYRELLYFLAWRDMLVRYKQTVIGVVWALLRPAMTLLVFVAFRRLVGIERGPVPDPILVFAAVLPWQFFSAALTESSSSLLGSADLISKVYFPRLIVPAAAVVTSLVDFAITLAMLAGLMMWYGVTPSVTILAIPLFVGLAFGLALGLGVLLAALNVKYRDFRYVVPFIVQFGLFVSPVAFTLDRVPEAWKNLYMLNPMVGIIEGFRWSIVGGGNTADTALSVLVSVLVTTGVLCLGISYFRRTERGFADVI